MKTFGEFLVELEEQVEEGFATFIKPKGMKWDELEDKRFIKKKGETRPRHADNGDYANPDEVRGGFTTYLSKKAKEKLGK